MINKKTNNERIKNFDTIKLSKRIQAQDIRNGAFIVITEGFYDVMANNENEFLLSPNMAKGTKFAPHTKALYAVNRELLYKNVVKTNTY